MHHQRMHYLLLVLIAMGLYFIGSDVVKLPQDPAPPAFRPYSWFLPIDVGFLALQVVTLVVHKTVFRPSRGRAGSLPRWFVTAYAVVILLWAGLAARIEVQITGNMTTVVVAAMAIAMLLFISFVPFCLLILSSLGTFFAAPVIIPGLGLPSIEQGVFLLSLALVSVFVSRSLFSAFAQNILSDHRLTAVNAELHATQLSLIQKEKFATIGQVSAGIAHEINNPLGFLKSNFSTLEQGFRRIMAGGPRPADDEAQAFIRDAMDRIFQDCREGFHRISEVIDNLRSFSYSPPDGSYGRYDLTNGVRSTVVISRNTCKHVARIALDLHPVPEIEARGSEINQVLLNLILNAVNAIIASRPSEEGLITISTGGDGTHVRCDIADSGPGVPEEIRARIFDPFFTTRPAGEGLGLGLSLSYEIIVNRHHGSLTLLDGRPTTFRVSLPIRQPEAG
jgi:two-component system NtrC family sensor kinase